MLRVDSRKINQGDIFVSLNNNKKNIEQAIKNGASKIVCTEGNYNVETIIVENPHEYLENYLDEKYKEELKDIKLIGVTGTNGKTTTAYLINELLNKKGKKSSYIGTIGFYTDKKEKDLDNTTPDIYELYELLLECKKRNIKYVVMEVSSHSLIKNRLGKLKFDYTVFTNLTQDHLDFHKTMTNYALAKQELFKKLKKNGKSIVNIDDEYKDYFLLKENNNITYGFKDSDYKISDVKINKNGSEFSINGKKLKTNLIGKHNIYNLLASLIVLKELNIKNINVNKIESPKGRMDKIDYNTNTIIIDYAHTPDAVENIINTVKELEPNKIYTLIGCGGDRDKTKRYKMALIATKNSNYVIFTSDNPRTEDPNQIINDMIQKLDTSNYEIITNRKKAIIRAIQLLEKNDILLILGKGHETYQIIGHEKIHFDDKEVALDCIKRRR